VFRSRQRAQWHEKRRLVVRTTRPSRKKNDPVRQNKRETVNGRISIIGALAKSVKGINKYKKIDKT
jgi:hypothetical protein